MKKVLLTAAALIFSMAAMNAQTEVKDPFVYEPVDGYVLKNLWIKSVKTLNDPSAALGEARGMAALNGELLFCRRDGDPSVSSIDVQAHLKKMWLWLRTYLWGQEFRVMIFK